MKKVLGLDLGTSSIGWSFVTKDEEKISLKSGVRIVPLSTAEAEEFNKGMQISTNAGRTQKRGARRTLDRYQQRRTKLRHVFNREGWLSYDADANFIGTDEIWEARSRAAIEEVSLDTLAKVFLHMNKKRGFKSYRKGADKEEDTAFKTAIKESDRAVLELDYTIGQWVAEQIVERPNISHRVFTNITFSRALHRAEFDTIWATQSKFHAGLTAKLKQEIGDHTIFFQRPLKSQKGLLSKCEFQLRIIDQGHHAFFDAQCIKQRI